MDYNRQMFKELENLNPWWENRDFRHKLVSRHLYLKALSSEHNNLIKVLIGGRRTGKTFLLKSQINALLDQGIKSSNILYITTESIVVLKKDLLEILNQVLARIRPDRRQKIHIFLDEIQEIPGWQTIIKYIYDNFKVQIYLSGSSSLILKEETSKLTGRFRIIQVLPLSFDEYLTFTGKSTATRKAFEAYLATGGYPEYVKRKDISILRNIVESTLYRDLLSLYGIRNPRLLSDLLDYLVEKTGTPVSPYRIKTDLKVDDGTARFYLQYLEDVYLIYPLNRFSRSHRITKSSNPKYYLNDTGIINTRSLNPQIGLMAENAFYLHLRRQLNSLEHKKLYYYIENDIEVDFFNTHDSTFYEIKFRNDIDSGDFEKLYSIQNGKKVQLLLKDKKNCGNLLTEYPEITVEELYKVMKGE